MEAANDTGLPDDILQAIDAELEERLGPHAGDPVFNEIRRVRRKELIATERNRRGIT